MKTEIIKNTDKNALPRAVDVLSKGGIIIYPTETCYGIGADATNDKAVLGVVKTKKRNREKNISVAFSDIKMAKQYLIITKKAERLIDAFMPGPITLIVESKGKKKVGFRIPDNNIVRRLIKRLGKPITTTSANIAGEPPLYKIKDVIKTFNGKVDLTLDAGNLKKVKPSTVFDVTSMKVLRTGPISERQIRAVLV